MAERFFHDRCLHPLALLLVAALMASPSVGLGQPPVPQLDLQALPAPDPLPPSPVPQESVVAETPIPAETPIRTVGCDTGYWIVSTRCCVEAAERCEPCHYHTYRFDGCQPGRMTNFDELLRSLEPGTPICFMVHGSFVEWDSMLRDSAATHRWLRNAAPGKPLHIVFFTWPSDDTSRLIPHSDINRLGRRATLHGFYLADLVTRIPCDHPVSLIGHSHGARNVCSALHALGGGCLEGRTLATTRHPQQRIRTVLAAAAMDHDWFNPGERFDLALCATESLLNLKNRHDFPLIFYPTRRPFSSSRAIALTGLTNRDHRRIGDSACRIVECDVTHLIGFGHIWAHYYRQPCIATAIRHHVYFDEEE